MCSYIYSCKDERLSKLPLLEQDFEGLEFEDLRTSEQTLTAYVQVLTTYSV